MASVSPLPPGPSDAEDSTMILEEGTLAEIKLTDEPPAAAAVPLASHSGSNNGTTTTTSSTSSSKMGPYAFPFSMAASCAFEKSGDTTNSKALPVPAGTASIAPPAAAAAAAASAHTEEEPNPEHPSLSLPAGAMLEADAESKDEGAAAAEVMAAAGAMELEAGLGVRAVGGDVRQAVRASLALGGVMRMPELVAVTAVTSALFSLGCIAAESTGWFLAYNGIELAKEMETGTSSSSGSSSGTGTSGLNLLAINIGWDRFSLDVNGAHSLTTRFLDDVSPGGYVIGIACFLLHLLSALASCALCLWLYHVFVGGGPLPRLLPFVKTRHARALSLSLLVTGGLLLVAAGLAFPAIVVHDFRKAFGPHVHGGFTVRPSWAYGLSLLVTIASGLVGGLIATRAGRIDRIMAAVPK